MVIAFSFRHSLCGIAILKKVGTVMRHKTNPTIPL